MAERFTLDNGFTVVFEAQHASRVAAFQVWVKAGSADERVDQAGLAHLHEHMLFKGTERRGPGEVAREIEANGGEINAWTSFDQTVYHTVIASPFARTGLEVLGDAVRRPAFDPGELAREIEVVCEEIKRSLDQPSRRASKALYATTFQVHPYGRPVIGTEASVRSFSREKVLEFYRRHYTPQSMILSAAGDISLSDLRAWAEEIFGGDWGRSYAGPVVRPAEPPPSGRRIQLLPDAAKEAYVSVAFHCPDVGHEDTPALDALSMVLGHGDASRLSMAVKRQKSLVNAISAYAYTPNDPGLMSVSMAVAPANVRDAFEESLRVLMEVSVAPVPRDELATVQALMESEAVYARETVQGAARKLGYYATGRGGLEEEARYYEKVARLTPEDLQLAAQRYLRLDQAVLSALLPDGEGLTALEAERIFDRVANGSAKARTLPVRPERPVAAPIRVRAAKAHGESPVRVEKLASGATLMVREEAAAPLFALRAAFLGGVRYEDDETSGLSALWGRTVVRGTRTRSAEALSLQVQDLAGSLSASTGRNTVNLRGEFLSRHLPKAFELFADVLNHPTFPAEEVERERRLHLQDLHTRDDRPSTVAFDLFARTLYTVHPYRLRLAGEPAVVERLRAEDLRDHHARYVDASRMCLAVVGDVQTEEIRAMAEEAFGRARGQPAPPPEVPAEPPAQARTARRVLPSAQAHLVLGFPGITVLDEARYALEVLSTVLSGQGGRLFTELRDKRSLAYSVSSYSVEGIDPGYFAVYIGTSPEKVDAALSGIRDELSRIRQEPITAAELDRARRHLIGSHEIGLQRNGARAGLLAVDYLLGLGLEKFGEYAERVSAITAAEVEAVARRLLDFDRVTIAHVGP